LKILLPGFKKAIPFRAAWVRPFKQLPESIAWKIETTYGAVRHSVNYAKLYKKCFRSDWFQTFSWQYMFGGLLRGVFGIKSPHRYWDREIEASLQAELKSDYETSKAEKTYGVYAFRVAKQAPTNTICGKEWLYGQPPYVLEDGRRNASQKARGRSFSLRRGTVVYVRLNRLDRSRDYPDGYADFEFHRYRSRTVAVVTCRYKQFARLLHQGCLLPLEEPHHEQRLLYFQKSFRAF
jgi:hypothetical protein